MAFARTWLRQSLAASGAITLLPAGVLLALAVAGTGGGLGSLGELVAGPSLPSLSGSAGEAAVGQRSGTQLPAIPAGLRPGRPLATGLPGGSSRRIPAGRRGRLPAGPREPGTRTPPTVRHPGGGDRPAPSSARPPAAGGPAPGPPNPVRQVGAAAQQATGALPPAAGKPVADAVGTVVDLASPPPRP